MSVNPTDPGQLFGGSWEAIAQGTFLISAGTDYTAQNAYGSATHTHTQVATTSGGPSNNTSGGPSNNTSGGPSNNTSSSTAISVAQMPSHDGHLYGNESFNCAYTSETTYYMEAGSGAFPAYGNYKPLIKRNGNEIILRGFNKGSSQGHTHTLSSHTHSLQSHTHSLQSHTHSTAATTTGSASNIPPSLAVYMWQRTG